MLIQVSCWLAEEDVRLAVWSAHGDEITALCCSDDSSTSSIPMKQLVSSCARGMLRLWDLSSLLQSRAGATVTANIHRKSLPPPLLAELQMNGGVTSLALDAALQLGVVGCMSGSRHYVNWHENAITLMSGPAADVM